MQLALVLAAEQNTANSLFPRPKVIEARCAVVVRNFCGRITRPKDRALPGKASTSERGGRPDALFYSNDIPAPTAYRAAAWAEAPASSELITKSKTLPSGRPTTGIPLTKK